MLIADDMASALTKSITSKGIPVECLFQLNLAAIDSVMTTFVLKQHGRYSVYITNFQ